MQPIQTPFAPHALGPYQQGQKVGNLIFFSGQIALSLEGKLIDGDITDQTRQVLDNINNLLISQNLSPQNVCKTTVFLTDLNNFQTVNEIYAKFFGQHKPAQTCIEVSELPLGAVIEIEIIAETEKKNLLQKNSYVN